MKPLKLIIEGFTCFKDRQAPVDFSSLDLFAITGPTGAGKTSVLDAVIFALYGKVPRVGKSYGELISLGRDRMSVVLDFEVGQRRFRVTRVGRRGRSGEAHLEEMVGHRQKPMAGGIKRVDEEVVKLLGLRYDAFIQAVVLPQGEFARFLKSPPRERREILRDLLRLQIYERMRKAAAEQAKEQGIRLLGIDQRLEQDYRNATPENLEELRGRAAAHQNASREVKLRFGQKQAELEELKVLHTKSLELHENRARLLELEKLEPQIVKAEARLGASRRVAPLVPLIEAADAARRRAEENEKRALDAVIERDEAEVEDRQATHRLKEAQERAEDIAGLRERLGALDEIKGLLGPRQATRSRLREARARRETLQGELAISEEKQKELGAGLSGLERELEEASVRVEKLGHDEELDRRLDDLREAASELAGLRRTASRADETLRQATKRQEELESTEQTTRQAVEEAAKRLAEKRQSADKADKALREAEQQHAALHLKGQLKAGKKCPVCEQKVTHLPPPVQVILLDALRSAAEESSKAEEESRRAWDELARQATKVQAELAAARREAGDARRSADEVRKSIAQAEESLRAAIGTGVTVREGEPIEESVAAAAKAMASLRAQFNEGSKEKQGIETKRVRARNDLKVIGNDVQTGKALVEELASRISKDEEELAEYESRITKVTEDPDPVAQRQRLAGNIEDIEKALKKAQELAREKDSALSSAEHVVEEARRIAGESATEALGAQKKVGAAVAAAGFEDEKAARAAVLDVVEQQHLDREISDYRQKHHAVGERLAELGIEVGDNQVTDDALARAEREVAKLRQEHEEGLKNIAALEQKIKELEQQTQRADELSRERESLSRDYSVYRRLADDLRSEHFQAYLLEEAFRELVRGASDRLMKLSGRYALAYREDSFHVLDNDNAGERRSADTLSGGETFLASLALALELSEQVQRASSAVNLGSLFIDEGFGTLDSENLDSVAAAIESLQVGGRMVGIITHIPELTERLPAFIRVEKCAGGSRLCQSAFVDER